MRQKLKKIRWVPVSVVLVNVLAVLIAVIIFQLGGRDPFAERGYLTFWSTLQLLAIALISDKIRQLPHRQGGSAHRLSWIWWVISFGFIFLAADEFLAIHEVTDLFIHDLFNLQETPLTDRIDDVIIGLYVLFGLAILWVLRAEFYAFRKAMPWFKLAIMLIVGMLGVEWIAGYQHVIKEVVHSRTAGLIKDSLYQLEESLKILAEAFLVLAFHSVFRTQEYQAQQSSPLPEPAQLEKEPLRG
jgi:hypothetical protein